MYVQRRKLDGCATRKSVVRRFADTPHRRGREAVAALVLSFGLAGQAFAQAIADPAFDTSVAEPAYRTSHPRVVVDEFHANYHTISGRFAPFAALLANDGYAVTAGTREFTREFLSTVDVLVIANAHGGGQSGVDAFTMAECDAVAEWIEAGGRMLLIADHEPFGAAARALAERFGVHMGLGHVFDNEQSAIDPTFISYTRERGLSGDHPITHGRNAGERVRHVLTFDGQSLQVPRGAVSLLTLGPAAMESENVKQLEAGTGRPVGGRSQGIAMIYKRGRIVIMAEAAMFTAQIYRSDADEFRFGMNVPGNDDRQFVLNVMHWLSGLL